MGGKSDGGRRERGRSEMGNLMVGYEGEKEVKQHQLFSNDITLEICLLCKYCEGCWLATEY